VLEMRKGDTVGIPRRQEHDLPLVRDGYPRRHDCAERSDELVKDKERANFCDQFQLNPAFRSDHPVKGTQPGAETPGRSAFDDLFKS